MDHTVRVESLGEWTLVALGGEIDVASAPQVRERLVALVADGATRLVVDLADVDFLDSTGLGVLVGALKRARSGGGDLRVACGSVRIRKVFELTGLDRALVLAATVDEAIAAPGI